MKCWLYYTFWYPLRPIYSIPWSMDHTKRWSWPWIQVPGRLGRWLRYRQQRKGRFLNTGTHVSIDVSEPAGWRTPAPFTMGQSHD